MPLDIRVPEGVVWKPKLIVRQPVAARKVTKKLPSLATLNKRLAATRRQRLAEAEANCVRLTGKNRL
jgi:hypothetical protein